MAKFHPVFAKGFQIAHYRAATSKKWGGYRGETSYGSGTRCVKADEFFG